MNMDFVIICPLVQHGLPAIRFLAIGSCFCSMLLSDHASGSTGTGQARSPLHGAGGSLQIEIGRCGAARRRSWQSRGSTEEQLAHDSNAFAPANLCKTTRRETFGLKFSNSPPTDVE